MSAAKGPPKVPAGDESAGTDHLCGTTANKCCWTYECPLCKARILEETRRILKQLQDEVEAMMDEKYKVVVVSPFIPGRADAAGTAQYVVNTTFRCVEDHFRTLPTQNEAAGDLTVSSLGVSTYFGPHTDAVDDEYVAAMLKSLSLGINVFDTSLNYRNTRSEVAVGRAMSEGMKQGLITREQVVVCTRGGYLTYGTKRPQNPKRWLQETYVNPGLFKWPEVVAGCHCMTPAFLKHELERSRNNLLLETIDVYYIHNPEIQLMEICYKTFYSRIREAFKGLEEACAEGKLTVYGIATWGGFRQAVEDNGHLSLAELVAAAQEVGGEGHHFRVVQLPYNLDLQDAAFIETQMVDGVRMSLLSAAQKLGISVVASASLMQANLFKELTEDTRKFFVELEEDAKDAQCEIHGKDLVGVTQKSYTKLKKDATIAQCALHFVRKTPGIMIGLAGMRTMSHVEENLSIVLLSYYLDQSLEPSPDKPNEPAKKKPLEPSTNKILEPSRSKSLFITKSKRSANKPLELESANKPLIPLTRKRFEPSRSKSLLTAKRKPFKTSETLSTKEYFRNFLDNLKKW